MSSLLNPPADVDNKSRVMAFTAVALVIALGVTLYFIFRYYPEKKAAERFFDTLVAGDIPKAYELWKPGPSYNLKDFTADWGPEGYYGPVKSYEILRATAESGSNAVAVRVKISPDSPMPNASDQEKSRRTKIVSVWVLMSDKSFSFPP